MFFKKKKEKPEAVKQYEKLIQENRNLLNTLLSDIEMKGDKKQ